MKKKGYRSGKKSIPSNKIAWTNEHTPETIIRKSDNAILTPLSQGDMILNTNAHNNIWGMANNPKQFIQDNIGGGFDKITSINSSSVTSGDINMELNFPNVTDYESFKKELQNDANLEKWLRSVTIDRAFGSSSLKPNRFK